MIQFRKICDTDLEEQIITQLERADVAFTTVLLITSNCRVMINTDSDFTVVVLEVPGTTKTNSDHYTGATKRNHIDTYSRDVGVAIATNRCVANFLLHISNYRW